MSEQETTLTGAEWSVMECLWERSSLSGRQLAERMHELRGWNRSTTLTLLSRIEAKGRKFFESFEGQGIRESENLYNF